MKAIFANSFRVVLMAVSTLIAGRTGCPLHRSRGSAISACPIQRRA